MANVKMTKVQALTNAIALATDANQTELAEKLTAMLDTENKVVERRANKKAEVSAKRVEFDEEVFTFVEGGTNITSQIATAMGVTPQKVTGAVNRLVKAGRVTRTKEKGKTVLTVA